MSNRRTGVAAVQLTVEAFAPEPGRTMELITILNHCHHFRGFVSQPAHFSADQKSIEVSVRPRKGSAAICWRCHQPAPGYDQLAERRFELIPLWGVRLPPMRDAARRLSWKEITEAFRTSWEKVFDPVEHLSVRLMQLTGRIRWSQKNCFQARLSWGEPTP